MTPAHTYFYIDIFHVFDRLVHYTALGASDVAPKMRA
jgi:hypothetical protein